MELNEHGSPEETEEVMTLGSSKDAFSFGDFDEGRIE